MSDHPEDLKRRRKLAWDLLRQTKNPEYVAMRYGFPVETMREALTKIPEAEKRPRSARAEAVLESIRKLSKEKGLK